MRKKRNPVSSILVYFGAALVLGGSGFAQEHTFSWDEGGQGCSVMTSSEPVRFCVVMGGVLYDDQEDLLPGKVLWTMMEGRYRTVAVKEIAPAEKAETEGAAGRPALPLVDCANGPDLFPVYTGPRPQSQDCVAIQAGDLGLLPRALAQQLLGRARAAFTEEVTPLLEHEDPNRHLPQAYDRAYLKGQTEPSIISRVKRFELSGLAVADVKIFFFDRVQGEDRPLMRNPGTTNAGWEKVPQDLIEVGAIQFIVLIGARTKVLKENPGFADIRSWYHETGDIYDLDAVVAVSDLDGNGKPEILMTESGYESWGWSLYEVRSGELAELVSYGCGV
jgi:hypothetical protein